MLERYDIFISYSRLDSGFVRDWLLPELEAAGFSVCVDFRDFDVGTPSVVNMSKAVERSRHAVLVLSRGWVESQWALLESLLGATADPSGRTRKLLPLLIESCSPPPSIAMLTYADVRDRSTRTAELRRVLAGIESSATSRTALHDASEDAFTGRLHSSYSRALTYLLGTQYPWGEWSDRRTGLESTVAERQALRGPAGPKPNVARTLFALDALEALDNPETLRQRHLAANWVVKNVRDGWYREWAASQTLDSEGSMPRLYLRKDIRHSAQAATISARWRSGQEPLTSLILAITNSDLKSGLWPESPGDDEPRILASVYAVEALAAALSDEYPPAIERLVGNSSAAKAWASFRHGVAALHNEADLGDGLLGESTARATPYLTGISLLRLARHSRQHSEIHSLSKKMLDGLQSTLSVDGWRDLSLPHALQEATRLRTTLRASAGLALSRKVGLRVDESVWTKVVALVVQIGSSPVLTHLDSPDFACMVLTLAKGDASDFPSPQILTEAASLHRALTPRWIATFEDHRERLSEGFSEGIPGYRELADELDSKLQLLRKP